MIKTQNPGLILPFYRGGNQTTVTESPAHARNYQGTNIMPMAIIARNDFLIPAQFEFLSYATYDFARMINVVDGTIVNLDSTDYETKCIESIGGPMRGFCLIDIQVEKDIDCGYWYYEIHIGSSAANFDVYYSEVFEVRDLGTDYIKITNGNSTDKNYAVFQTGWQQAFYMPKNICVFDVPDITVIRETERNGNSDITIKAGRIAIRQKFEFPGVPDWALLGLEVLGFSETVTIEDASSAISYTTKDYQFTSRTQDPGLNIGEFSIEQSKVVDNGCDEDFTFVSCSSA